MKNKLLVLNHVFLLLCVSMYLGTGASLVLFSFPIAPALTVDNYYLQFVPQVQAATAFFTTMTKLMLASSAVMLIAEWRSPTCWVPILVLACVVAATWLTMQWIFPLNALMASRITEPTQLQTVLQNWMQLNRLRMLIWSVQWLAMAWYFGRWAYHGKR
jgi:hypothetical protein